MKKIPYMDAVFCKKKSSGILCLPVRMYNALRWLNLVDLVFISFTYLKKKF